MADTLSQNSGDEAPKLSVCGYRYVAAYDLVLDCDGQLLKVQCKAGRLRWGRAVQLSERPADEVPNTGMYLRVDPPRNRQSKRVRWAKEYELPA